jgi:hypothetical protein
VNDRSQHLKINLRNIIKVSLALVEKIFKSIAKHSEDPTVIYHCMLNPSNDASVNIYTTPIAMNYCMKIISNIDSFSIVLFS